MQEFFYLFLCFLTIFGGYLKKRPAVAA